MRRPEGRGPRPSRIARDNAGQWLLLTAIVAAIGLGVIMILLNTAVLNGHSSIISIASFPKNDIRDLRSTCISEAVLLSGEINKNDSIVDKTDTFNARFRRYVDEIGSLYHAQGAMTDIRYTPHTKNITLGTGTVAKIVNVSLVIIYYNSDTIYIENVSVGT